MLFSLRGLPSLGVIVALGRNLEKLLTVAMLGVNFATKRPDNEIPKQFPHFLLKVPTGSLVNVMDELDKLKERVRDLEKSLADKGANDPFRRVVESAPYGIVVSDGAGRIVMVNRRAEEMFGYTETEFMECSIADLVPPRFSRGHEGLRQSFHQAPEPRSMGVGRDLFACRKDGTEFLVEIALTPLPGASGTLVLSSIIDITERKRSEEELRFQAEILRNVHDAVFYVTQDGIVRDWNEGAARIFSLKSSEAIGQSLMEICSQNKGHLFTDRIIPAIRKRGVAEEVIHCRLKSGREVYIRAKITPMSQKLEEGYVFCASDITKEKRLEAELVRISENEQRRIGQDIHDDLCSQLSGIGCMTKVLEHRLKEAHAEEADMMAGITEMVAQAGTKAREIAKGLVPTVLETQGLAGALRELALRKREMVGVNCIAAVSDEELIEKLPDYISIQLYRIAQEGVTNAIKHSDAEIIEISLRAYDGRLELRIRDDGKGMPRDQPSTGMGLLTMQRRSELISADFSIQASPGGGAYIRCIVPLVNHD